MIRDRSQVDEMAVLNRRSARGDAHGRRQVAARLVIVSRGDPFDASTGHYLDNIVAYALPLYGA